MAKYTSHGIKLTVDHTDGTTTEYLGDAASYSGDGGRNTNIVVHNAARLAGGSIPFNKGGYIPNVSLNTTKREAVIKHVLEMAKAVEKQRFEGARLVELAEAEAIDATNKRLHGFNLAVLSALHEGISNSEVQDVLLDADLLSFCEDVEDVNLRDFSALYPRVEADGEE